MGEMKTAHSGRTTFVPSHSEVDDLVRRAMNHPLGKAFLAHGSLDAVAATFSVHAFVVDAARDRLLAGSEHA